MGVLLGVGSGASKFARAVALCQRAVERGVRIHLYLLDDAVREVESEALQSLKERGATLHACAYAAQKRGIPLTEGAVFSGLTVVGDLVNRTDRFISFV